MQVAHTGAQRASLGRGSRPAASLRIAASAVLATILMITMVAPTFADVGPAQGTTDGLRADYLRSGDRVVDHGVAVIVPERGEMVWAGLELEGGVLQTLQVETTLDGSVRISQFGEEFADRGAVAAPDDAHAVSPDAMAPDAATTGGGSAECSQRANNLYSWRTTRYPWRYASATTPSKFRARENGQRAVVNSIKRALRNITGENNICSRGDRISASGGYRGTTSHRPGITSSGYCGGTDRRNVVGFGELPSRSIAMACVHSRSGRTIDGDVKISWDKRWETRRSLCSSELLVEPAMTHEFGHIFGLAHVSSWSLTMQPVVQFCSRNHASLGLGDMLGLERKY